MLESIAAATLHLGFPVSVDMNRPMELKGSTPKRSSKKAQARHVEDLPSGAAAREPSPSNPAFDWFQRLSENYSDLFSCGKCYASQDLDDSDIDANSILLGVPSSTQAELSENLKSIFVPLPATPNGNFPTLQRAHPIMSDDGLDKSTSFFVYKETSIDNLKPGVLTAKQNKDFTSQGLRDSSRRSQENTYDADEECTTATTASVNSIASWNTVPTRETSFESVSFLDNVVSFRSYDDDLEGLFADKNYPTPRSLQHGQVLASPSHLRRSSSDPIYAV